MTHPDFSPETKLTVNFQCGCFYIGGWDCVRTDLTLDVVVGNIHEHTDILEE